MHIAGVDSEGKLAHWIARDLRSYRPEMFSEAAGVLRGMLSEEELQVGGWGCGRGGRRLLGTQDVSPPRADVVAPFWLLCTC